MFLPSHDEYDQRTSTLLINQLTKQYFTTIDTYIFEVKRNCLQLLNCD